MMRSDFKFPSYEELTWNDDSFTSANGELVPFSRTTISLMHLDREFTNNHFKQIQIQRFTKNARVLIITSSVFHPYSSKRFDQLYVKVSNDALEREYSKIMVDVEDYARKTLASRSSAFSDWGDHDDWTQYLDPPY